MSEKTKNENCKCSYTTCPRHGNCEKCQEYHHRNGGKTSCGK